MKSRFLIAPLAAALLLAGCVTVPTGPAVTVLPGTYKSFDQFQADDGSCRQFASATIGGSAAGQPAQDAAAANAIGGAALGAAAGAIIGSVTGQAGQGAAIGAGTGLLFGSAAGSNVAGASSYSLQRRYDSAYMQCMYAHGQPDSGPRRIFGRGAGLRAALSRAELRAAGLPRVCPEQLSAAVIVGKLSASGLPGAAGRAGQPVIS